MWTGVLKWLRGIVAAVIAGILVWWLTEGIGLRAAVDSLRSATQLTNFLELSAEGQDGNVVDPKLSKKPDKQRTLSQEQKLASSEYSRNSCEELDPDWWSCVIVDD